MAQLYENGIFSNLIIASYFSSFQKLFPLVLDIKK
jgi:hypothetical protein